VIHSWQFSSHFSVKLMSKVHETAKFVKHWIAVPDHCYECEGLEQNSRHLNSMQLYMYRNGSMYFCCNENTGHFIRYSRITKMYYRKAIGHVFTKPVQIEGTTQKFVSLQVVFHRSSHVCSEAIRSDGVTPIPVCLKLEYCTDVCRVTCGAHVEHL
jgi:hypothetical protein